MKLARLLIGCANRSLVLIDELELALHPKAQIELLSYLNEIAAEKNLTIIFSTHSVSLLKRAVRRQIFFLENNNGKISALKGCFPTYTLGNIAYDEERAPDTVIYVEDEAALYVTEALVRLCITQRHRNVASLFPTVHVIPIGPFISVVRFLERSDALLPPSTQSSALLDADVKTETLATWQQQQNHTALAEFARHQNRICFLPWTPEVGLIQFIIDPDSDAIRLLREKFGDHRISIRPHTLPTLPTAPGKPQREAAKQATREIIEQIHNLLPNMPREQIKKHLFYTFATWYFQGKQNETMALILPLVAGM